MKVALLLVAVVLLAGCGTTKPGAYDRANVALLDAIPVYPGAAAPKTSTSGASTVRFGARDWTLPASATERGVIQWYEQALPKRGWKVTDESFATIRAARKDATLSIGVRGRTLEAITDSRGG